MKPLKTVLIVIWRKRKTEKCSAGKICRAFFGGRNLVKAMLIAYNNNKDENGKTNSAIGYNDSGTALNTVNTFNNYHLTRLYTLKQVSNQPGACAEPHAVAAALKKADETKGKGKGKTATCAQWISNGRVLPEYLK